MASRLHSPVEQRVGRYCLYGEIASGGMAAVHFGRLSGAAGFQRTVAIKRLHPQFLREADFVSQFMDEARIAAFINHPNVVQTLDVVCTDDELLLVMEYVHGETLAALMQTLARRGAWVPLPIAAAVLSAAMLGLHAAHEACDEAGRPLSIVHRDVSPQNILIGRDGVARMLDFGVAKANQRVHSTQGKQLKGKFRYMAPEQVLGGAVDRRTDVFAAGVILWRLLTGRHLFGGSAEPAAILNNVLHLPIEKPSMLVSGIPAELDAVTLKALERDPDRRFSSALELALALQKAIRLPPTHEIGRYIENVCAESLATRTAQLAEIARARGASTGAVSEQDQKPPPTVRLSGSAADHEGMTGTRPVQARRDDQEEWRTERVTGGGWLAQHALDDRSAGKESQKPRRRLSLAVASAALTLGAAGLYLLSLEQSPASSPLGSPHPPVVAVAAPSPPVTVLEPTPALALDEEQRPAAEETPTEETAAAKPAEAKPRAARRPPRSKPPAPTSSAARPKEPAPPVVDPLSRRK